MFSTKVCIRLPSLLVLIITNRVYDNNGDVIVFFPSKTVYSYLCLTVNEQFVDGITHKERVIYTIKIKPIPNYLNYKIS